MPTDISLAKIEFVLLMCSVTELANPQFAFSTNWNLYHRIFNSELPFFCHLKWLDEILGTTNFRSWQSFFFLKSRPQKLHHPKSLTNRPGRSPHCIGASHHHHRWSPLLWSRSGSLSLHRCETLSLGTLLQPLRNPSFGMLLPPLRKPSFGTLLSPLWNPNFGTWLQPQFSRLVD